MRVLVIGGTGFIGPFVVRRLADAGHSVTVLHRGNTVADLPPAVNELLGDRKNLPALAEDIASMAPEVVLDMILGSSLRARDMMDTVRGTARRVVAASSGDVYRAYGLIHGFEFGPPDPVPYTEDGPLRSRLRPHGADARWMDEEVEKIEVEEVIMGDPGLPGTILRLPAVYGPGDYQHRLFADLKRMDDGRPAILFQENMARWRWSRGYVENVAAAIALAVTDERAAGRIYNVAEPDALTQVEWVGAIARAAGWNGDVMAVPKAGMPEHLKNSRPSDQDWVVDTTRIRRELGYAEHVSREDALARTVAWERANAPDEIDVSRFDYAAEDEALARIQVGGGSA